MTAALRSAVLVPRGSATNGGAAPLGRAGRMAGGQGFLVYFGKTCWSQRRPRRRQWRASARRARLVAAVGARVPAGRLCGGEAVLRAGVGRLRGTTGASSSMDPYGPCELGCLRRPGDGVTLWFAKSLLRRHVWALGVSPKLWRWLGAMVRSSAQIPNGGPSPEVSLEGLLNESPLPCAPIAPPPGPASPRRRGGPVRTAGCSAPSIAGLRVPAVLRMRMAWSRRLPDCSLRRSTRSTARSSRPVGAC